MYRMVPQEHHHCVKILQPTPGPYMMTRYPYTVIFTPNSIHSWCDDAHIRSYSPPNSCLDDLLETGSYGLHVAEPGFEFVLKLLPFVPSEGPNARRSDDHFLIHLIHLRVKEFGFDQIDDVFFDVVVIREAEDAAQVAERDLFLLHGERESGEDAHLMDVGLVIQTRLAHPILVDFVEIQVVGEYTGHEDLEQAVDRLHLQEMIHDEDIGFGDEIDDTFLCILLC